MPGSLHRRLRVRWEGGARTQGCTWSNRTPGSMLVQPWKARDKLKDKSTDVDKHNMGSERRQSFTNPFQPQVSMITLLRRVHRGSLDESRLDQEGREYSRNYICSTCLKVSALHMELSKMLYCFSSIFCLWSSQIIPRSEAQKALTSYQRANFPRDRKMIRVPALREARLCSPRLVSTCMRVCVGGVVVWVGGSVCGWDACECRNICCSRWFCYVSTHPSLVVFLHAAKSRTLVHLLRPHTS